MGDIHALLVGVAHFLGEDVKEGTTGTREQTRADLADVCRALALASIADSLRRYLVEDVEDHPHLRVVEAPEDASPEHLVEELGRLYERFTGRKG